MVHLRGSNTMANAIGDSDVRELAGRIHGQVVRPGDAGFDSLRGVFNAMIDRRPAVIIRCADANDVRYGVDFARSHSLPLAVRGGGHSVAGHGVCDGGVMLDLSAMKGIRVDPSERIAVAQPGLTLGEFDHATQHYGLATTTGIVSVTGLSGLTLGGGLGWLNGKHGLACDNLISAEVVTADGEHLSANENENPDLFWGLRGGGGNFGVVTSLTYRLHPLERVLAGGIAFAPERAADALRFYHEFASEAPDELATVGLLGRDENGKPMVSVAACYSGQPEDGERVLRPLREFGSPIEDSVQLMDYCVFQSGPDAGFPLGRQHYWKSSYLWEIPDGAVEVILSHVRAMPSPYTAVGLQQMTGVASRVDPTATAFPHRARQYDFLVLAQWDDPADSDRNITWARSFFDAMGPYTERAVYVNNLGEEDEDRVRSAYGVNYERLAALKARYDATNFFRHNHNIAPTRVGEVAD